MTFWPHAKSHVTVIPQNSGIMPPSSATISFQTRLCNRRSSSVGSQSSDLIIMSPSGPKDHGFTVLHGKKETADKPRHQSYRVSSSCCHRLPCEFSPKATALTSDRLPCSVVRASSLRYTAANNRRNRPSRFCAKFVAAAPGLTALTITVTAPVAWSMVRVASSSTA